MPTRSPITALLCRAAMVALPALALAAPGAAAEVPAESDACNAATLKTLIVEYDPVLSGTWDYWPGIEGTSPLSIACRRIDGDDIPDALWRLDGGGSGGAFNAGVAVSGAAGAPASMAHWIAGSHLSLGLYHGKAAIAWPRYRKSDPNCCATGGYRWRYFGARADGSVYRSKLRKSKRTAWPLKPVKYLS